MTIMLEARLAQLNAQRNNIARYRRLLRTKLTDVERQYIEKRLAEEEAALESLTSSVPAYIVAAELGRGAGTNAPGR